MSSTANNTQPGKGDDMSEWLPIETAPENKMFIWGYWKGERFSIGLAYRNVSGGWSDAYGSPNTKRATHWMPLPPPPTNGKG